MSGDNARCPLNKNINKNLKKHEQQNCALNVAYASNDGHILCFYTVCCILLVPTFTTNVL
jgi:hypothetical protein